MKKIELLFILIICTNALFSVIEETESLQNFLHGSAPGCAYDNWMSHISEGIADPGYNLYAPWDVQTNGFGNYAIPDADDLLLWSYITHEFLLGNLDLAQYILDVYSYPYQVVIFHDTDSDRTFHILREIPNMTFYDNNGTEDPGDDEFGAFDLGWGLYIYYPQGIYPHITTAPHPNDDYFTVPLAYKAFIEHESKFLLISGCGREVTWTNIGNYNNSKSTCDPSREEDHVFNVIYQRFCDHIRTEFETCEFSLQIHSYDWGERHWGYPNVQISGGYQVSSPDLPIRDHSSAGNDIVNVGQTVILPANSVGIHPSVYLNDYYGFHCNEYDFTYSDDDTTFAVNTSIDLPGYGSNRQMVYTNSGLQHYDVFERFFHIEMDELPNVYPQTVSNYHWFHGWNPVSQCWEMDSRFEKVLAFYSPWIEALRQVLPFLYQMNDNEIPVAPGNLQVITECADHIEIQWTPGDCFDMESYEILYSSEPIANGNYAIRDRANYQRLACLAQNTYKLTNLQPGDQFYFAVRIRDKNGNYSAISNEVFGTTGPASVDNFICYGRDEHILLEWEASSNAPFDGFNIYRKTESSTYSMINTWLVNPYLTGQVGNGIPYFLDDTEVENGVIYTYRISYEDDEIEYFFGDEPQAVSRKIYNLYAYLNTLSMGDTCYFGYNEFASNGYDANFDLQADTTTVGEYFFSEFYEQYWNNVPNHLEQEIYSAYDPAHSYKSWVYRIKTNLIGMPVEIGIANLERDAERLYLYRNGTYTDLATSVYTFTPNTDDFYSFTLYLGNLVPNVTFTAFSNQLLYPNEVIHFDWSMDMQVMVDHVNVYAANDEIAIPIEMEMSPYTTETYWTVPQLLFENLTCRIDLVMDEGDTLHYYAPFRFGIISPQNIVQTYQGWHLMTKNFSSNQYTTPEIFGEGCLFYEFQGEEFISVDEPEFLHPYWLNASADNYFVLTNATMQRVACSAGLNTGWNLLPNPHLANYTLDQLVFTINNTDYEYYQAVENRLIEPVVFDYEEFFEPAFELYPAKAYYLYCYEEDVTVKFIPYFRSEYVPNFDLDWQVTIDAEQNDHHASAIIVGTCAAADSLYDPNYDILKPLARPFESALFFSLPMEIYGATEKMHRSIFKPLSGTDEQTYTWNAELQLVDLEPLYFQAQSLDLPADHDIYLIMPDCILDLSANEPVEYIASDSLLNFSVVITNQILSGSDDTVAKSTYSLQNYPNPFNPQTTITFFTAEKAENAELVIYNIKGQKVKTLIDETLPAGKHSVIWDGKDSNGKRVGSGVYFYKLEMKQGKPLIKKMLLLK